MDTCLAGVFLIMIIIFSNNQDYSTFQVVQWLEYLTDIKVLRINSGDLNRELKRRVLIKGQNAGLEFEIGSEKFSLSEIQAVWVRKGKNWLSDEFFRIELCEHTGLANYLTEKMKKERQKLGDFINYIIARTKPVLGTLFNSDLNKLIVLDQARSAGLAVPDFVVSNSKSTLIDFLNEVKDGIITKSLSDGVYHFDHDIDQKGYFTYTEELKTGDLEVLKEVLTPSFVQKKIEKSYELRVFYLEGELYAMAIFSQSNESTKVDFRKYNSNKPNRAVPYLIPAGESQKIKKMFDLLDLNTGSMDLIVDSNDVFYFLEINPVGQFGMVSTPCNYMLEKKIALNLIEKCQKN